jgi:AcrR family transcriptional regulator
MSRFFPEPQLTERSFSSTAILTARTQETKPRRRLTADERRRAILSAAQEVFAGRGYHGSSIDEIAQAAGISKALIYEHFPSKKDLHVSLLDMHVQELFERLAGAAATDEPGDVRLRKGLDAFLAWVEEHRDAFRMVFRDAADPEVADVVRRVQAQATTAVAALMATEPMAPAASEEARELAISMLAQQLTGGMQALALWWDDHPDVPREVVVDSAMDFCWLGLERVRDGENMRAGGTAKRGRAKSRA